MQNNELIWENQSLEQLIKEAPHAFTSNFSGRINLKKNAIEIDSKGFNYRDLNFLTRKISKISNNIILRNVLGQRYIGTNLEQEASLEIYGVPGNDLGAFMNGSEITVYGNVQDGCGNTMNQGRIIIKGSAGDILGYSMRGGKIFVRDNVGYRVGIHMKEYRKNKPCIVVGGTAEDFLGEYMAGGILVILGLNLPKNEIHETKFVGTGMHGGVIYIHGEVIHTGKEVEAKPLDGSDWELLEVIVREYCNHFENKKFDKIINREYHKLIPASTRPYGTLYAY